MSAQNNAVAELISVAQRVFGLEALIYTQENYNRPSKCNLLVNIQSVRMFLTKDQGECKYKFDGQFIIASSASCFDEKKNGYLITKYEQAINSVSPIGGIEKLHCPLSEQNNSTEISLDFEFFSSNYNYLKEDKGEITEISGDIEVP